MRQAGGFHLIFTALLVFLCFPGVPVLYRTIITGDAAVYFCVGTALRTGEVFTGQITVILADRICR